MFVTVVKIFRPLFVVVSRIYFSIVMLIFWGFNVFITKERVKAPRNDLLLMSAVQAAKMIRDREITSLSLVSAYIQRIEDVNNMINAVVQRNFENALSLAQEVDNLLDSLDSTSEQFKLLIEEKPLFGVPFTLKDCLEVDGILCTVGISCRRGVRADKNAVVVERMKNAGAILLAVTNVPEVCLWWESVNVIYGRTKNPYDTRRIAGGSSGGEAALISAAGSVIGIGSDIAGSIRMPACFNGVFGLKPTSGVVPLMGHLPQLNGYRAEMLQIGPICRYAEDLLPMLKIFVGKEGAQTLKLNQPVDPKKIRIFYMEGLNSPLLQKVNSECLWTMKKAIRYLELKYDLCAVRVDLRFAHYALEFFLISMEVLDAPTLAMHMTDLKSEINCFNEICKWLIGRSVHTLPVIITAIIDKYFSPFNDEQKLKLKGQRDRLYCEVKELLSDNGVLLFPTFPTSAPYHHQPLFTPLNFGYTALWNTLAVPAIHCPLGLNRAGIPTGVQVVAAPGSDRLLIAIAESLESGFGGWRLAC